MRIETLSEEERTRIHAALAAARQATTAEIELVIVPASDRYAVFPVLWGGVSALTATGILALVRPHLSIGVGFAVNAALTILFTFLFDWWPIRIRLAPRAAKHEAASRLAHREFAVRIVARSPERNGVMVFVSLAERYAEILADRAAHTSVPEKTWDRILAGLTQAMSRGERTQGVSGALAACGEELAAAFPRG